MSSPSLPSWPSEAIELAALPLGRAAGATLASEHRRQPLHDRGRRAVIDEASRRDRRPDTLVDDRHDLEDALALDECLDTVAGLHRRRGFGCDAVHADVTPTAGGRCR